MQKVKLYSDQNEKIALLELLGDNSQYMSPF